MSKNGQIKKLSPIQILIIGNFVLSFTASLCNIFANIDLPINIFFPNFRITVIIANMFSTVFSIVVFFFPKQNFLLYLVLVFQSVFYVFLGYVELSIFLFTLFIILFYILTSLPEKKQVICITIFFILYFLALLGCIPYGIERFSMALASIFFIATAFICVVRLFKTKLKNLIPIINQDLYISKEITLPKAGEKLNINDFDLSEREKSLLFEVMVNNKTYGELGLKFNLSTSLVKKEMSKTLGYFKCRNIESLKIVFSQFDVVME